MSTETRARLLSAAERLFAERGIDAVSLREITRESGARNAIAAQYHFADRAGLVQAILDNPAFDRTETLTWSDDNPRRRGPGVSARRQIAADLLMVKTDNGLFTNYRDVAAVDGKPVKDRGERALALFTSGNAPAHATLARVAQEGARYNLGTLRRTLNVPTLPLFVPRRRLTATLWQLRLGWSMRCSLVGALRQTCWRSACRPPIMSATPTALRDRKCASNCSLWIANLVISSLFSTGAASITALS